jgi:microcystin-dependent protein
MSLTNFLNISKIETAGSLSTVTISGVTVPVYKCTIANLEKMFLPSPDSGSRYQGVAVLSNQNGDIGLFVVVAGNPKAIASGSLGAREVWLAEALTSFWNSELRSNDLVSESTNITIPAAEMKIGFRPITGSNPQNANNITPKSASGACVSATLIDHSVQAWSEDLLKLLLRLTNAEDKLNLIDPTVNLKDANSVVSGGILSLPSPLVVQASSSSFILKGNSLANISPVSASLNERSVARLELIRNGLLLANYENSSGGVIDADYQCAALPFSASSSWTKDFTGASSELLTNDLLRINKAASAKANYSRATVGNLALGATERLDFHQSSIPEGAYFDISINGGSGSVYDVARVWGRGSVAVVQLLSKYLQYNQIFGVAVNPLEPFSITLNVTNSISRLFINGQLADTSVPISSPGGNGFLFGFQDGTSPAAWAEISRVVSRNGVALIPSFSDQQGPIVGNVCTTTAAATKSVGLQGLDLDYLLGSIKTGKFAFEGDFSNRKGQIGQIFYHAGIAPPDDGINCLGAAISRLTYRNLFGQIGTIYGAGDGSNTFNVPNAAGKFLIASNGTYPQASQGGAATVSLTGDNNGAHNHVTDPSFLINSTEYVAFGTYAFWVSSSTSNINYRARSIAGYAVTAQGSGTPHENMPPYLSIPLFIKWR